MPKRATRGNEKDRREKCCIATVDAMPLDSNDWNSAEPWPKRQNGRQSTTEAHRVGAQSWLVLARSFAQFAALTDSPIGRSTVQSIHGPLTRLSHACNVRPLLRKKSRSRSGSPVRCVPVAIRESGRGGTGMLVSLYTLED